MLEQISDPFCIFRICLTSWNSLHMMSIDHDGIKF